MSAAAAAAESTTAPTISSEGTTVEWPPVKRPTKERPSVKGSTKEWPPVKRTVNVGIAAVAENESEAERRAIAVPETRIPPAGAVIGRRGVRTGIRIRRVDLVRIERLAGVVARDGDAHPGR